MFFTPSLDEITNVMKKKGYKLYTGKKKGERGLNLVGIRRSAASPAKFDDTIAIFFLIPPAPPTSCTFLSPPTPARII